MNPNTLFSYTGLGLDIDAMNRKRQPVVMQNLNAWQASPQTINVPAFDLNTQQRNQNQLNWQQQLQQVPSVPMPKIDPMAPVSGTDSRLNQLDQLQQQLAPKGE